TELRIPVDSSARAVREAHVAGPIRRARALGCGVARDHRITQRRGTRDPAHDAGLSRSRAEAFVTTIARSAPHDGRVGDRECGARRPYAPGLSSVSTAAAVPAVPARAAGVYVERHVRDRPALIREQAAAHSADAPACHRGPAAGAPVATRPGRVV